MHTIELELWSVLTHGLVLMLVIVLVLVLVLVTVQNHKA